MPKEDVDLSRYLSYQKVFFILLRVFDLSENENHSCDPIFAVAVYLIRRASILSTQLMKTVTANRPYATDVVKQSAIFSLNDWVKFADKFAALNWVISPCDETGKNGPFV